MTIERQYGKLIFICDVGASPRCDEQIETGESDFSIALVNAKAEGWGAAPLTGNTGWMHFCGKCPRPR